MGEVAARRRRSLIDVDQLTPAEMRWVFDMARSFEEVSRRAVKKVPALRGKTVVNLFFEPSTRTRISFELAAKRLSADVINFAAASSSVAKGEALKDTVLTLQAMGVDALVVRHPCSGAPGLIDGWTDAAVINAGDGMHAHPTQALLDCYTLMRRLGDLEGRRIAVVGDIMHSRVARSCIKAFTALGAEVVLVAPPTLMPAGAPAGIRVSYVLEEVLEDCDVFYLLRLQMERQEEGLIPSLREYAAAYQMDLRRLERTRPHALVMHPGPINRGVEISAEVADHPRTVLLEQVTSGLAVRMAVLFMALGGKEEENAAAG